MYCEVRLTTMTLRRFCTYCTSTHNCLYLKLSLNCNHFGFCPPFLICFTFEAQCTHAFPIVKRIWRATLPPYFRCFLSDTHPSSHPFSSRLSKSSCARTSEAAPNIFSFRNFLQLLLECYQSIPGAPQGSLPFSLHPDGYVRYHLQTRHPKGSLFE